MYKFFVGVDVSKEWIDASWTDGSNLNYVGQFTNSILGFGKLLRHLKKETLSDLMEWFICFENTGTYSKLLLQWLCSQGIPCREENSLKISKEAGLRRGKSDRLDSAIISKYAFKNRHEISPTHLPIPAIEEIKKLLSRREFLIRHRSALKTSLKEQKAEYSPELFTKLDQNNTKLIEQFDEGIELVEQRIEKIIQSENELKKNNRLVQSITGIGPIITWYMIAYSGNFKNFKNSRKFSSYTGTAPFPNTSGKSKKEEIMLVISQISRSNHYCQMVPKRQSSTMQKSNIIINENLPKVKKQGW
jgi:transposase